MVQTIWIFGLPSSGKTTIARELKQQLSQLKDLNSLKQTFVHIDADHFRNIVTKKLGFSKKDRITNINHAISTCKRMNEQGHNIIASFITPYEEMRENIKEQLENTFLVYLDPPLDICIERDVKGLYKRALAGEIKNFTGINDPFEPGELFDIKINTADHNLEECIDWIIKARTITNVI